MSGEISSTLTIETPSVIMTERRVPVQGSDRIAWRLSSLVIVVGRCRGRQTGTAVLQILIWALRSSSNRKTFRSWWVGDRFLSTTRFRFDPQVDATVDLGLGIGLLELKHSGKLMLTEEGIRLSDSIWLADGVMTQEKEFLLQLSRTISEAEVRRRLGWDEVS